MNGKKDLNLQMIGLSFQLEQCIKMLEIRLFTEIQ